MSAMNLGMKEGGPGGMWDDLTSDLSNDSAGMRIYRKGLLPGERPAVATRAGSAVAAGQVACANCHQRSGLGAREGQQVIPAVAGAVLYAPKPGLRSAYTDQTLAVAIREGVDPDGRPLSPLMPRYAMQADELAQLIDYLKTLAPRPSPGVANSVVHLATVVTEDVAPARKQAMLEVMQGYLQDLNEASVNNTAEQPGHVAQPGSKPPLRWQLHVWSLTGTAQNRRTQLQSYYAQQHVFALVGGLSTDTWLPIHQFCQQQKVPCLFPNTSVPVSDRPAFYAMYFDKGSVLKAQILARYFADHAQEFSSGHIVQVLPGNWSGYEPAAALRQAMGRVKAHRVVDQVVQPGAGLPTGFWRQVLDQDNVSALILWGEGSDLTGLAELAGDRPLPPVFLADDPTTGKPLPSDRRLNDRLRFISTLDPAAATPAAAPWSAWMKAHHLVETDALLQANTYFVMSLIDEAVRANAGDFTPEHLIERIEYSVGSVVPHPMLASLSLGMGQRFAAKGGYILTLRTDANAGLAALTDLVVP
ncbi:MAG TPA: ABC transporter substrate-binding protein [Burkholderiaceae bacterium]|nr:ABC transporter substrate-binding protein [Burkholderiaceae bacterium]